MYRYESFNRYRNGEKEIDGREKYCREAQH